MPKQLINIIGLVISLGVIALGVFLVAVPLYVQTLSVSAQTATVVTTNELYQSQVDSLRAEEARLDEIDASVAALRTQLPATAKLDDVFEVVGQAAAASGVTVQAVTAGVPTAFVVRTDPTAEGEVPIAEAPVSEVPTAEEPAAEVPAEGDTTAGTDAATDAPATDAPAASTRQQIDFVISVSAADAGQVTAFLDALRSGPRLLSSITATSNRTGEGTFDVQVSALTFTDAEG